MKRNNKKKKLGQGVMQLTVASYAKGKQPIVTSHVGDKSTAIISQVECTHTVEKANKIGYKPKYPCKICKGDHLTHTFPWIPEVWRVWSQS